MNLNSVTTGLWIILMIAAATVGLIIYCVVAGVTIPAVVMTLLGVVLGFLGSHLSSAQGATQALASPSTLQTAQQQLPQQASLRLPPGIQLVPQPEAQPPNRPQTTLPATAPVAYTHPETGETVELQSTAI